MVPVGDRGVGFLGPPGVGVGEGVGVGVGVTLGGFGFVAALILVLLGYSTAVMLNVIFISFSAGSIIEGFVQLYYYRKGIRHA